MKVSIRDNGIFSLMKEKQNVNEHLELYLDNLQISLTFFPGLFTFLLFLTLP